tara:strand:+ start:1065 stop:1268 length:204 start_codon:yes stop_codon:yes gene_type:complete
MRATMKKVMEYLGYGLIALGIMAMAGSAGDCDGKCVEQANTMFEMLTFAGLGLAMMLFGFMLVLQKN